VPNALSQPGGYSLGAQAGEQAIGDVVRQAGFTRFRRAAETPFTWCSRPGPDRLADSCGARGTVGPCAPANPTHRYAVRSGVRLYYEEFGSGSPTVLLLPTWAIVHSRTWKLQVRTRAALSRRHVRPARQRQVRSAE